MVDIVDTIRASNLFDEAHYLSQFDAEKPEDALQHFCDTGWQENKDPAPWFSVTRYLTLHDDIKAIGMNPFFHYIHHGIAEGRDIGLPWFNMTFYQQEYADIIPNTTSPYQHFLTEGLQLGLFPTDAIATDSQLNQRYLKQKVDTLPKLEHFIETYAIKSTLPIDYPFYTALYDDLADYSETDAIAHYQRHGETEDRLNNFDALMTSLKFSYNDLPILDLDTFFELNPLLTVGTLSEIYLCLLQFKTINFVRLSDDIDVDVAFYTNLGTHYLKLGEPEKAKQILLYVSYLKPSLECYELLGNIELEKQNYVKAREYYRDIIDGGAHNHWAYANLFRSYEATGNYSEALDTLQRGLKQFPQHGHLMRFLDDTIKKHWQESDSRLKVLAKMQKRTELMEKTAEYVAYYSEIYQNVYADIGLSESAVTQQSVPALNNQKVLIIGDYHIPQCIRYRIEQKVEQLTVAGYEVSAIDWMTIDANNEVFFSDIILIYRAPAVPELVKLIAQAKALDKIVIYEIDDLIFEPAYPANYAEYAGTITMDDYAGLVYGMALWREAAKLCDYAIASTKPLVTHLQQLVSTKAGYLHRNGLDAHNTEISVDTENAVTDTNDEITIFYGSGTLAHNTDFVEIALPAITKILRQYRQVRLMIVGHLTLPTAFIAEFAEQLVTYKKTKTIDAYWNLLAHADINLAVLENNVINNCKSELKWFEAACFKTPSVVSDTTNYRDVIHDKEDGILAETSENWYHALDLMVQDKSLRNKIGNNAYERVQKMYSIETLSKNIDAILQDIVKKHGGQNDA